ncbi:MAG: tetratricopeptide repeat protein, partial [Methanomassiliicoccales archaeon]
MGFLFSREGEPRSIKKAVKLVEESEALIVRNDIERAKIDLKKASEQLASCPITDANSKEMSDAMSRMADDMMHCDMTNDALSAAERAVQISPSNMDAHTVWIRMLSMVGRSGEALSMTEDLILRYPDKKQLWVLKGVLSDKAGRVPDALESYKKALSIDPLDIKLYELVISKDPERTVWMRKKAELLLRLGKTAEASRELDRIISVEPSAIDALHLKAEIFLRSNDAVKAQQVFDIILSIDPENKPALLGKARQTARDGNVADALNFYKGALQVDTSDIITWNEVAGLLLVANRYEESNMAYDRALSIDPQNRDAAEGKARAVQAIGTGTGQSQIIERTADIRPSEAAPTAEISEEIDRLPEQPAMAKQAATQDAVQDAKSLISSGRYHDAVRSLEKALKFAPEGIDILTEIKECYKRMGKDKKVIEISDKILSLDASNDLALLD